MRSLRDQFPVSLAKPAAVLGAAAGSAALIVLLFLSLYSIETALPRFGFFSIREFHIAIRDVSHLRDMVALARLAPDKQESLDRLTEANDLVYIRFTRIDGPGRIREMPDYEQVVPRVEAVVAKLDTVIAGGLPLNANALAALEAETDAMVAEMNDLYYDFGERVNVDLHAAETDLRRFNYQIAFTLALLSALAIGTALLLINRREAMKKLQFLAWSDRLTGLKNRAWMLENFDRHLGRAAAAGSGLQLYLVDLDYFKEVNDTFGHDVGDMLLQAAADILRSAERDHSVSAVRMGGDEFAVLAYGKHSEDFGARLCEQLNTFIELGGHQVRIGASIGMARSPDHGNDIETLMRHADCALYAAKAEARGRYIMFSPQLLRQIDMQLSTEAGIVQALNKGEFLLAWQPQFELATGRMSGAEALLRWRNPQTGAVSLPASFIPAAEKSELILEIDRLVLHRACRQAAEWVALTPGDFIFSVNVSGKHLYSNGLVGILKEALRESGLPAERLELEITEGVFIQNRPAALDALAGIKAMGVGVALDDFGTGYSSLSYLADLEISRVKIDQSFLGDLESSAKKQKIVSGIIALGNSLGMKVVAEGVETESQAAFLINQGCDYAQGFLLSKPLEATLLTEQLKARMPSRSRKDSGGSAAVA